MRIVEVREIAIDIHSEIRNAAISFSGMDASAVAVLTDVFRDGAQIQPRCSTTRTTTSTQTGSGIP